MQKGLSSNRTLYIGIALSVSLIIAIIFFSRRQLYKGNATTDLITHSHKVLTAAEQVLKTVIDYDASTNYFAIAGQQQLLPQLQKSQAIIKNEIAFLKELTTDNRIQNRLSDSLLFYAHELMRFNSSAVDTRKKDGLQSAATLLSSGKGKFYLTNISRLTAQIEAGENLIISSYRKDAATALVKEKILMLIFCFAILCLLIIIFWREIKNTVKREKNNSLEQLALLSHQINQSNDAIYTIDTSFKIKTWNKGAENLYGFSAREALERNSHELLKTALTGKEVNDALNLVNQQNYWAGELKRKTKTGNDIYVQSSTTTVRDNAGHITGYVAVSFDITEKKKIREQMSLLAGMVEHSSEAIFSRGADQRLLTWNNGAEKLFGYTKEDIIGKTAKELGFIRLNQQEIMAMENQVLKTGSWTSEMDYFRKDGSSFYGSVTANLIQIESGKSSAFYFIIKDISERKKLEDQLRQNNDQLEQRVTERTIDLEQSEKKYRYLFERNPLPMWIMDTTTFKFLDVNETAITHYGYSRNEFLNMTSLDIRPESEKKAFIKINHATGYSSAEINNMGVWSHIKKDGSLIQVEINVHQVNFGATPAALVLVNDITEKIKAEQTLASSERRYKAMVENNEDIVTILDENMSLIYRSDSAERIIGWTTEEFQKINIDEYFQPDYLQYMRERMKNALDNPGKITPILTRVKHKAGHYIWLEGTINNLLHDKCVKGIITNVRDVTQRIQAKEKLASSEKRFRTLIENNRDVITLMDDSFKLIYRSPAAARITGWSDEDMLDVDATRNIHPDDVEEARAIVRQVMANPGKQFTTLFRNLHKNGHYIWMEGILTNWLHDKHVNAVVFNYHDVTERIAAQEKLSFSEKRFRALIENNYDVITLLDKNFKVFYRSPSAQRITGWSDEEMFESDGENKMSIHPDDRPKANAIMKECLANPGKPVYATYRNLHKNGHYIWLEGAVTNLLQDEYINAIVFNFRDITERVAVEDKLQSSEKRFRSLIENISDAIVLNDADTNILYQSPSVTRILGYTAAERKQKKVLDYIHPADQSEFTRLYEQLANKPGLSHPFQYRFFHKDGRYIWLEGVVTNLINDPSVNAYVANYRDVTERKTSEEAVKRSEKIYKTIASSIPGSIICLLDMELRYQLIEGDMIDQLGYSKTKMLGKKAPDVLPPETFELVKNDFESAFKGEIITREYSHTGLDTLSRFIPLKDDNHTVYAIMTLTLDVTNLKDAQRGIVELNQSLEGKIVKRTEELKRSNEELEAFSYSVSHDLRAPLRAVIGYTTILEEDYCNELDDEAKRLTGIIKDNTVKMGNLIDGLLSFSRMGRHEIAKIKIDQNLLVKSIITDVENKQTEEKRTKWILHSLPDINAESYTIKQVWVNLISNAVKYSANSPAPVVEIGSFKKNGQTAFFVRDNGVGFDEKYKTKLFKVFQRLHSSSDFEGTGIGLAIVEKIINKHGGNVWVEAELNKGACFYFSVPDGQ